MEDIEITDTNMAQLEAGRYRFIVSEIPEKGHWKENASYYDFTFLVGPSRLKHQEKIPVWTVASLLRALGCKEVTRNRFEWKKSDVLGVMFEADIVLENYTGKDGNAYVNRRVKNPAALEGFPKSPEFVTTEIDDSKVPF